MSDMPPAQREMFRQAILRVLDANGTSRFGLTADNVTYLLPQFGFRTGVAQVERELHYLSGEPLAHVETIDKAASVRKCATGESPRAG